MISLRTADSALKNVYLDVIKNELNNEIDPFYSKIVKTEQDIAGNSIKKLVSTGVSGGIGAGAEDGNLPIANSTNYVVLTSELRNLYGQLEISDKAIRASSSDSGAFLNLLTAEMDNLIESSKYNFRHMIYGHGDGYLSTTTSVTDESSVYTVVNPYIFVPGMRVSAKDSYGDAVTYVSDVEVLDVDYENSTITLPSSAAFVDEEDGFEAPFEFFKANTTGNEIKGLLAIADGSNITSLYGLTRSSNTFLYMNSKNIASNSFGFVPVLTFIDDLRVNNNANTDIITVGYAWRRAYQNSLKNFALNTDIVNLAGGVKSVTLNGIPVFATRFIAPNQGYMLDSSTFKLHQLCDWSWLANDKGEILHQKEGYAVQSATLAKYCDMICDRPNKNGVIYIV